MKMNYFWLQEGDKASIFANFLHSARFIFGT